MWQWGVYIWKVEKDTSEPWNLRSRNVSMTSEEFYRPKIIDITIAKSSFTVVYNMIFDSCKSGCNMFKKE